MDFEKSKIDKNNEISEVIRNILKFITSLTDVFLNKQIFQNIDTKKINKLKSIFLENINYYTELEKIIDDCYLNMKTNYYQIRIL